jgi:DNA-binding NarL/FixJ family response regulator
VSEDKRIRILIVDDHAVVRAGLRALIDGESDTMRVVDEAAGGEQAVRLAALLAPDVVLMDLRLDEHDGGFDGTEATRRILAQAPGTKVVVLTSHSNRSDVRRALDAGALGYVLKAGPPEELFRAIHTAAAGGLTLSPEAAALYTARDTAASTLSGRELEVIRLLAEGLTNRAIAKALFLTEATVKSHLVRIYRKLDTDSRSATIAEAHRRGLIDLA